MAKGPKKGETIAFDFAVLPSTKREPAPSERRDTAEDAPEQNHLAAPQTRTSQDKTTPCEAPPSSNGSNLGSSGASGWTPAPLPERPPPSAPQKQPEGPRVLSVGQLGRVVGRSLERTFAAAVGSPRAVAVNSCTSGLHAGLVALGVKPGDEVVTTPYTFVASVETILLAGARPVGVLQPTVSVSATSTSPRSDPQTTTSVSGVTSR